MVTKNAVYYKLITDFLKVLTPCLYCDILKEKARGLRLCAIGEMFMKRKFFSFLLCTCFLLSGCNAESGGEEPVPAETEMGTADPAETSTAPEETEEPSVPDELSLDNISFRQLSNTFLSYTNTHLYEYFKSKERRLGNFDFSYVDAGKVKVRDTFSVRDSTRKIALTDAEKQDFASEMFRNEYMTLDRAAESSAYSQFSETDAFLMIENLKISDEPSNALADVVNAKCGYRLNEHFSVNAFVARDEDGTIRFIPDPAYLYGIPVIATNPEHLTFDLNGMEVMMDSFMGAAVEKTAEDFPEVFEKRGTDFFYAKIYLSGITVNYDFETGYDCTAVINLIMPITDDVEFALIEPYLPDDPQKDPGLSEAYRAIIGNLDTIYKDSTHGITLLDLDFDGTPEVLVSDIFKRDRQYVGDRVGVDVSIYRIENGDLKYIDTFPNAHWVIEEIWNSLGLKTLPDGTKAWFSTSYDDGDFLYRLEGDQWIATKVLTEENPHEVTDENGNISTEYDYYFMGEKIEPTVIHEELAEGEYGSDTHYEWNGITSYWGEMWELIGFIRADFCSDITETYFLYGDWLSPYPTSGGMNSYEYQEHLPLTDREFFYNLAYMTDSYFLGSYNPASRIYEYWFLGAYAKPVIYLYPEEETEVSVQVNFTEGGELTCTYPEYGNGWEVTALPDGTIYDKDGNEYYCLYWEGEGSAKFESGKGWCVAGSDTAAFLREKLLGIGLTAREANEFIIYWLPELQKNPYNIITFHTDDYAKSVPLTVSPMPDTVIRVFMTYEPVDAFIEIEPQVLPHYEREGFTLVEWGGSPSGEAILR